MQLVQEQLVLQQLEVLQLQQLEVLQLLLVAPANINLLTSGISSTSNVPKYSSFSCPLSSAAFFSLSIAAGEKISLCRSDDATSSPTSFSG
jgi:hypothetical protein